MSKLAGRWSVAGSWPRRSGHRPAPRTLPLLPRPGHHDRANAARHKAGLLTLPVLAIGGEESIKDGAGVTLSRAAHDVQSVVIANCGHRVAEEGPEEILATLTTFLAPYHDRHRGAQARSAAWF
ncbi:alpha/beta fold hydrolase [Streptomyces sp. NPDC002573]|uniref:alpha/beta fold hydrolase n=1 Tax=Streptomyces sp. NPDC002573 TaxID=3364651 RepID=UPI0036A047E8